MPFPFKLPSKICQPGVAGPLPSVVAEKERFAAILEGPGQLHTNLTTAIDEFWVFENRLFDRDAFPKAAPNALVRRHRRFHASRRSKLECRTRLANADWSSFG